MRLICLWKAKIMSVSIIKLARLFGRREPNSPRTSFRFGHYQTAIMRYGVSIASVALVAVIRMALNSLLGEKHPYTLFFAAVAVTSWFAGFWPSILAIVLSYLAADWFFTEPRYAFDYGMDDLA